MSETTPSSAPDSASTTAWARKQGVTKNDRSVLLGARIRPDWLNQSVSLLAVRLTGVLAESLLALLDAAKSSQDKNLPILRLRSALMAKLDGVVRLDRDLGLRNGKAALELRWAVVGESSEADVAEVKNTITSILQRWQLDLVNEWAERNALGSLAAALQGSVKAEYLDVRPLSQLLAEIGPDGRVNKAQYDLIAKHIAERLDGEELFPTLGPCTVIADAAWSDAAVELTTWPKRVSGSDSVFSMVARLSVLTWPTRKDLYLKITPTKRVWAKKAPGRKPNAPANVTCYVFNQHQPVLPARIRRSKDGWEFGDEYQQYRVESGNALPSTLDEAVAHLMPGESGWWVGLPELTALFDHVQQRTVFESDEVDLFEKVTSLLPDALDKEVPYRVLKQARSLGSPKSKVERLQVGDIAADLGLAGASLAEELISDGPEEGSGEAADLADLVEKRHERLERHRVANQRALERIHGERVPSLWVFVDGKDERDLIERSARAMFGDRLRLEFHPLPPGVHGLREKLDSPTGKGIERFEARLERWEATAKQIAQNDAGARHVLICAPKDINRKAEDPVNYFAGLHAMSRYAQANVHHLLPLEEDRKTKKPDVQHFIHRTQSALLDVFLAHSGIVFGVDAFVEACLGDTKPKAIYGVQVVRSQAQAFTQEQPASLIVFSRLDVATGVASVRFVARHNKQTKGTDWQPLNEGLRWLGSQRQLTGDERWLKDNFSDETRKALGAIGEDDPQAVVMVDWSTVRGLWKDLTDESLSSSTTSRVMLDDVDFRVHYPKMTILRLRFDRNATMVMRWVRNTTFEEVLHGQAQLKATHQTVEEHRATTYKTIVELDKTPYPHYLMVMGYRNTVQTKRGMSCYRTMPGMVQNKTTGLFERRQLKVASDNAALPSGLEVTVLQHADGVDIDSLARLVMGLRLGYAHYDDWTMLPAPLFFVSKVRDYIIRYPELDSDRDEPPPTIPEGPSGEDDAAADSGHSAVLRSELVAEVLHDLPQLAAADEVQVDAKLRAIEAASDDGSLSLAEEDSDDESEDELPESLPHPLLNQAYQAALKAPQLYSQRRSGREGRELYNSMLTGRVHIRVELPAFVTRESVLPASAWPTASRAIGKFWRRQSDFGVPVRPGSEAPSVATFPDWVMKRLAIPQGLWSIDMRGVFPTAQPLLFRTDELLEAYVDARAGSDGEVETEGFWGLLPELVSWCSAKGDDDALGWLFVKMAHYPHPDTVPRAISRIDQNALGPKASAALEYMTTCFEVCRQALDERRSPERKVSARVIAAPAGAKFGTNVRVTGPIDSKRESLCISEEFKITNAMPKAPDLPMAPVAQVLASWPQPKVHVPTGAIQPEPATSTANLAAAQWPIPGDPTFDEQYEACVLRLQRLKDEHVSIQDAIAQAQQRERERVELEAEARAEVAAKIAQLDGQAVHLVSLLTPHLSVGAWAARPAAVVFGVGPAVELLEQTREALGRVDTSLHAALEASKKLVEIDEGRFDGVEQLGRTERIRRKGELLTEAAGQLAAAEAQLKGALEGCALFAPSEGNPIALAVEVHADGARVTDIRPEVELDSHPVLTVIPTPGWPEAASEHDTFEQRSLPETADTASVNMRPGSDAEGSPARGEISAVSPPPTEAALPLVNRSLSEAVALGADSGLPQAAAPEPESDDDELAPESVLPAPTESGPVDLSEPAINALLACVDSENWALATIAVETLRRVSPGQVGKLWAAAIGALHSAQKRQSVDATVLDAVDDWFKSTAVENQPAYTFADHLGAFGTSLVPMLLEGRDTRIRWAAIPYLKPRLQQHEALHRLLERLESLDSIQLEVTPETLAAASVGLHQAMQDSIRRFRERAANWPTDPVLTTNWSATDYIDMHQAMFSEKHSSADDKKHAVGECLAAIAKGNDDRARRLWPEVKKQADKGLGSIADIRKRIGRRKPIEGAGRDCLVNNLEATAKFIGEFLAQLDRQQESKQHSLPPKHEQFLHGLYRELQAARDYVRALGMDEAGPKGVHRVIALKALEQALRLMDQTAAPSLVPDEDQLLLLEHPMGRDLLPTLDWQASDDPGTRVRVGDTAALIESVTRVDAELRRVRMSAGGGIQKLLTDVAADHRTAERVLSARLIEQRLAQSGKVPAGMGADNDKTQREARSRLATDLQDAKQRVTNAMSLNALPQTEASRMLKLVDSLTRANTAQEIGATAKTVGLFPDYPQARAVLQQLVLKPLEGKIEQSRRQIEVDIDELLRDREQRNIEPSELRILKQKAGRIRDRLRQGTALSVRVARNEFLLLREDKLPLWKGEEKTAAQRFEEFRTEIHKLTNGQRVLDGLRDILKGVLEPRAEALDLLGDLSAEERLEAVAFIDSWVGLFKTKPRENIGQPLQEFFRGAGVPKEPTMLHPAERKFFFEGKPFAGLGGSLAGIFIPPALGSDATHVDGIVVQTSTSFVQLQQKIAELRGTTPTFVLAHLPLTLLQRAQLGHDQSPLLVDDLLVAYLAVNPATRLAKLLEVCLLSCRTNPYADYGNRPVPPEMFFGREEELRKLREVPSAGVLYGGRRLGKSSLLSQILEESKANVHLASGGVGSGEMAAYVSIDSKNDPAGFSQDYLLFSWRAIYKSLVGSNFLKASKDDLKTANDVREYVQSEIAAGRSATNACYLLIDEADDVMREDLLHEQTPFLGSLQKLSDAVMGKCRVRYVVAGLHNLSRMTTASNSVLGKATTIALQPFSSTTDIQKGIDLITKPLSAMGFHFGKDDESLPMRIMAVSNFYPAFIQLYCRNLVTRLYNKRSNKDLPTLVTSTDLDAVERDPEFLRDIQEKFGLNLNLDKRYKAIALILAEYSYAEPTGGFTGLTVTEVRDHCAVYAPEHFRSTAPGAYEALLDEMEKLTILERNRSRYQLRTPDIATMLGDKDQVTQLLAELAREKPTNERSRGEVRLRVRQGKDAVTLPMPSAWLRNYLQGDKGDLVVVVGNNLSGVAAFERLRGSWEVGQEEATIEGLVIGSPEDARTWINRERKKSGNQKTRVVAVQSRSWTPTQIDGYASVAQSCGSLAAQVDTSSRAPVTTMRPLLAASPAHAFDLAHRLVSSSLPRNVVITPAHAWSDDAVYFWLNDLENQYVRDSGPARAALLQASCGFGAELERMCSLSLSVDEALKQPEEARKRLAATLDGYYEKLGLPEALTGDDRRKLEDLLQSVHGETRSAETEDEFLSVWGVPRAHFVFAQWMGLAQASADGTWQVPALYLHLIKVRGGAMS